LVDLDGKRRAPVPLIGLIYDNVPTGAGYWKTHNASMQSFPQRFTTNISAGSIAHTLLILLFLSVFVCRYENPEDFWRKAVLTKSLIDSNRIVHVAPKEDK
jgi:hypothetical protein